MNMRIQGFTGVYMGEHENTGVRITGVYMGEHENTGVNRSRRSIHG